MMVFAKVMWNINEFVLPLYTTHVGLINVFACITLLECLSGVCMGAQHYFPDIVLMKQLDCWSARFEGLSG